MFDQPKPQNAVAAIRVSSIRQGTDGDSPEAQKEQIERYAKARNIKIKKYFAFLESASKETQPMQEAVDYCTNPKNRVQLLIVKSIDRFTRGGSYSYSSLKRQLDHGGVRLVDLYGIIGTQKVNTLEHLGVSYGWSVYDPTKNSEILEAERASDEKRDIMSRLMGAEIRYTRLGYWMRKAPYGYASRRVDTPHGKRTVLVPHPTEAQYISRMFELRCRRTLSDQQIVDMLNRIGFKTRTYFVRSKTNRSKVIAEKGGKPMTCKSLQKLITNTLYAGVNCESWTGDIPVKCRFNGIVSPEAFNKANRGKIVISDDRRQVTYATKKLPHTTTLSVKTRNYPYRRVVLCPHCNKPFLGSGSRGRNGKYYMAYHCNRSGHYLRIPKERFDSTVEEFARIVRVKPAYTNQALRVIAEEWDKRQEHFYQDLERKEELLKDAKSQARIITNNLRYTRSATAIEYIEHDLDELAADISQVSADIEKAKRNAPLSAIDILPKARSLMNCFDKLLAESTSPLAKECLLGLMFDSLPTYDDLAGAPQDAKGVHTLFVAETGTQ
jgi:hypothetical protein